MGSWFMFSGLDQLFFRDMTTDFDLDSLIYAGATSPTEA
jgi:hypothetical protein